SAAAWVAGAVAGGVSGAGWVVCAASGAASAVIATITAAELRNLRSIVIFLSFASFRAACRPGSNRNLAARTRTKDQRRVWFPFGFRGKDGADAPAIPHPPAVAG